MNSLSANFACSLCTQLVQPPLKQCQDDHLYCGGCIDLWLKANSTCPQCHIDWKDQKVSKIILNTIESLRNSPNIGLTSSEAKSPLETTASRSQGCASQVLSSRISKEVATLTNGTMHELKINEICLESIPRQHACSVTLLDGTKKDIFLSHDEILHLRDSIDPTKIKMGTGRMWPTDVYEESLEEQLSRVANFFKNDVSGYPFLDCPYPDPLDLLNRN